MEPQVAGNPSETLQANIKQEVPSTMGGRRYPPPRLAGHVAIRNKRLHGKAGTKTLARHLIYDTRELKKR